MLDGLDTCTVMPVRLARETVGDVTVPASPSLMCARLGTSDAGAVRLPVLDLTRRRVEQPVAFGTA